jgi:hypothetical protein
VRYAFCVTTWSGARLQQTIAHLPRDARVLVVDTSQHQWSLSRAWNYGIDRLCTQEGFDAAFVLNDDVILRHDTAALLADALENQSECEWTDRELLLISARHASPSDACTDEPDWTLLDSRDPHHQPGPDFSAFITSPRLFEKVGRFDEGFAVWCGDNSMHRLIQMAGYEAGAYAPYWHFRNGTTRSDPERQAVMQGIFDQDRAHYVDVWGGWLGAETHTVPYGEAVPA